jgi:hypothetical protein
MGWKLQTYAILTSPPMAPQDWSVSRDSAKSAWNTGRINDVIALSFTDDWDNPNVICLASDFGFPMRIWAGCREGADYSRSLEDMNRIAARPRRSDPSHLRRARHGKGRFTQCQRTRLFFCFTISTTQSGKAAPIGRTMFLSIPRTPSELD